MMRKNSPTVIAVVGGKKSGKTTAIELLTKELAGRGIRIAVVKHIPELGFTIDQRGKDTWRFAQAGAKKVVVVSADEIATIEKTETGTLSLKKILRRCRDSDLVFLEGFRDLVAQDNEIHKILLVQSAEEAAEDLEIFRPVIALTGTFLPKLSKRQIPYVDVRRNPETLGDLIEKMLCRKTAR